MALRFSASALSLSFFETTSKYWGLFCYLKMGMMSNVFEPQVSHETGTKGNQLYVMNTYLHLRSAPGKAKGEMAVRREIAGHM